MVHSARNIIHTPPYGLVYFGQGFAAAMSSLVRLRAPPCTSFRSHAPPQALICLAMSAAVIWTAVGLASSGSVPCRYGFSCFCQNTARGSCIVRAAPVRAQTRTSTDPPSSNCFCHPPLSWDPAGRRSIVSLYIDRARAWRALSRAR